MVLHKSSDVKKNQTNSCGRMQAVNLKGCCFHPAGEKCYFTRYLLAYILTKHLSTHPDEKYLDVCLIYI